jgi:hypothetical protein
VQPAIPLQRRRAVQAGLHHGDLIQPSPVSLSMRFQRLDDEPVLGILVSNLRPTHPLTFLERSNHTKRPPQPWRGAGLCWNMCVWAIPTALAITSRCVKARGVYSIFSFLFYANPAWSHTQKRLRAPPRFVKNTGWKRIPFPAVASRAATPDTATTPLSAPRPTRPGRRRARADSPARCAGVSRAPPPRADHSGRESMDLLPGKLICNRVVSSGRVAPGSIAQPAPGSLPDFDPGLRWPA